MSSRLRRREYHLTNASVCSSHIYAFPRFFCNSHETFTTFSFVSASHCAVNRRRISSTDCKAAAETTKRRREVYRLHCFPD